MMMTPGTISLRGTAWAAGATQSRDSHKRGRISVTVGDKETFIESKIVDHEILHSNVVLVLC